MEKLFGLIDSIIANPAEAFLLAYLVICLGFTAFLFSITKPDDEEDY